MKKLLALNTGTAVAIAFLIYSGYLGLAGIGTSTVVIGGTLVGLTALGVALLMSGNYGWSLWLSNHMTRFGMAGTAYGLITGLSALTFTGSDALALAADLAQHMGLSFSSTLIGILGNIWLNLNFKVAGHEQA